VSGASLDHVYFWTGDLDRAVAYYRDVLGLRLLRRQGPSWAEFEAGPARLGLHGVVARPMLRPAGATVVMRVEDLEREMRVLEARGALLSGPAGEIPQTGWFASLLDPDGNTLLLIEYSRDPWTGG
jgi:predicted enzyme related to lactoylglutathione lyase